VLVSNKTSSLAKSGSWCCGLNPPWIIYSRLRKHDEVNLQGIGVAVPRWAYHSLLKAILQVIKIIFGQLIVCLVTLNMRVCKKYKKSGLKS
jgi:hypothetical protein